MNPSAGERDFPHRKVTHDAVHGFALAEQLDFQPRFPDGLNVVSTFRNYSGFSKTWLRNQHIMMSLPVGAEWSLFGNENIRFNIGATLQPTFVVNNQAYMISTNLRSYAKAPSLYREFNVAAGAEMFLSIKGRSLRYNIGPQFRYQLFSSYKRPYPISEFLTDYGLKVSIGR